MSGRKIIINWNSRDSFRVCLFSCVKIEPELEYFSALFSTLHPPPGPRVAGGVKAAGVLISYKGYKHVGGAVAEWSKALLLVSENQNDSKFSPASAIFNKASGVYIIETIHF